MNDQINSQRADNNPGDSNDELVNARFSDAASDNQRDIERELDADAAAAPSYELHLENENRLKTKKPANTDESASAEQAAKPQPADEDATSKFGEERGGTTNLSLDQLKKEGGEAG